MKIQLNWISEKELAGLQPQKKADNLEIPVPKIEAKKLLILIIVAGFLINQFLLWRMDYFSFVNKLFNINISVNKK